MGQHNQINTGVCCHGDVVCASRMERVYANSNVGAGRFQARNGSRQSSACFVFSVLWYRGLQIQDYGISAAHSSACDQPVFENWYKEKVSQMCGTYTPMMMIQWVSVSQICDTYALRMIMTMQRVYVSQMCDTGTLMVIMMTMMMQSVYVSPICDPCTLRMMMRIDTQRR